MSAPKSPMTPLEKALTWHKLGKAFSPNAESVKHVDTIVAELERLQRPQSTARPRPDPALLERIRYAVESAQHRQFIAVGIDIADMQQLLECFESPTENPNAQPAGDRHA